MEHETINPLDDTTALDELIVKSLQGRATEEEEGAIHDWRARSKNNDDRYIAIARIWSITEAAKCIAQSTGGAPDADALIQRTETPASQS